MELKLRQVGISFSKKPLLIGGKAMEYYGLRKAGADIDLVVAEPDYKALARLYPGDLKEIWGDKGVCVYGFEIWRTICMLEYEVLSWKAREERDFLVVSFDMLLTMRALAVKTPKYFRDYQLMIDEIRRQQAADPYL